MKQYSLKTFLLCMHVLSKAVKCIIVLCLQVVGKLIFFGNNSLLPNASFKTQLHGSDNERVRNFCYLGVTLDKCLSWKEHVSKVFTKVNTRLGLLGRFRTCLTLKAAKCVYNCLVLPVLCYTDTAWGELSVECKSRLQRLQNRAARIIVRRDSTSEALKTLGWPNLETIRKRNKSILVFKCLNDLVPQYLSDYFNRNHSFHSYNTRQREDIILQDPNLASGRELLDTPERFYIICYLKHTNRQHPWRLLSD